MPKRARRARRKSPPSSPSSHKHASVENQLQDLREWKRRLMLLLEFGKKSTAQTNLDRLLSLLADEAKQLLSAERATGFLLDRKHRQLWSKVALGTDIIRVPMDRGIAGTVAATGKALNIPDAYRDGRFNPEVDRQTGYRTRSVLTVPMKDIRGDVIGVFQVLNRSQGNFNKRDEEFLTILAGQAAASAENAQLYEKLLRASEDTILRLASAAEFRDKETHAHLGRMSRYSVIIAEEMDCPKAWIENLRLASPLHDIGKIGVPDSILRKPGKLTEEEWKEMRKHPLYGADILKDSDNELIQMSQRIALCHHEWWNGQGYPRGLKGKEIPLEARIAAVADVFDALSSRRVYKPSYPLEQTVEMMRGDAGLHYDPQVIEAFLSALPRIKQVMPE